MRQETLAQAEPTPGPAGQLTSVMRAAVQAGPKTLRIGVAKEGRVVEERVVRGPEDVTVGQSERSQFVVRAAQLPGSFRLFQRSGRRYYLCFTEQMVGRVALVDGVVDLHRLKGKVERTAGGVFRVPLDESSRGKVVIGDTTFLFQFVDLPPSQPKAQLPASMTRGAVGVDWPTTVIAAASFMLHFLALGAAYSDWLDPIIDQNVNVVGIVDSLPRLPVAPIETPEEGVDPKPSTEDAPAATDAPPSASPAPSGATPERMAPSASPRAELEKLGIDMLRALAPGDGIRKLERSEVPMGTLDDVARRNNRVSSDRGLELDSSSGPIRVGRDRTALADLGNRSRGDRSRGEKQVVDAPRPKPGTAVGGPSVTGVVPGAEGVIASLRGRFRACYNRELATNPDARGTVRLTIRVGTDGSVHGVSAHQTGTLGSTGACVQSAARSARFREPVGGSAAVVVPVSFFPQR